MRAALIRWGLAVFVVATVLAPVRPASALDGPNITVGDVSVDQGISGVAAVTIPVDLSSPSNSIVTVQYTIESDTAMSGVDFAGKTGKLTFRVGATEKLISVSIFGDTTLNGETKNAQVVLSVPVHAQIEDGTGEILIRDNPSDASANAVSIGDATVVEADSGVHYAYVPITLSAPAASTIRLTVLSACGTAADPAPASSIATIRLGQRSTKMKYPIVADTNPELTQYAYKHLKLRLGNAVVTVPNGTLTIDDNDGSGSQPPPEPPAFGDSSVISQSSDGQLATAPPDLCDAHGSTPDSISADGRYVVFHSDATNLVPNDTNYEPDLFLRDRLTGTTERVDVTNNGGELVDGIGGYGFVSDDGRYVNFTVNSPELTPPDTYEAFVRDRTAGTTTLVSVLPNGSRAGSADATGISGDGRYVAFVDTQTDDLYVRDLLTSTTQFIAPSWTGWDWTPMTDNGEIAFVSSSSTLVPGDTNGYPDVFVANIATGAIDRVNLTNDGAQESGNTIGPGEVNAARLAISRDGRYVVFWSASANMGVPTNQSAVFIRDRVAGTTELASVIPTTLPLCYSQNEGVSNDGRYVSFSALCESADTTPVLYGTMVRDRLLGTTTRVDALPDGTPGNGDGGHASEMSADGKWVVYESSSTNLLPGDDNHIADVFIRAIS